MMWNDTNPKRERERKLFIPCLRFALSVIASSVAAVTTPIVKVL